MKVQLQSNTVLIVVAIAAASLGVYLLYRKGAAAVAWVAEIPAHVAAAAREGGQVFQQANTPNVINTRNTPGIYQGVFNDPLINDDGVDFRYF